MPVDYCNGDNLQRAYVATQVLGSNVSFGNYYTLQPQYLPIQRSNQGCKLWQGCRQCATVGLHTIINTGATVDHDSYIEAYCHIAPGFIWVVVYLMAKEHCGMGEYSPNIRIGRWSIIGAGSVVTKDVPDG